MRLVPPARAGVPRGDWAADRAVSEPSGELGAGEASSGGRVMSMLVPVPAAVGGSGTGASAPLGLNMRIMAASLRREAMQVGRSRGRAAVGWQVIKAGQDGKKIRRKGSGPRIRICVGGTKL